MGKELLPQGESKEVPKFKLVLKKDYLFIKGNNDHEIVPPGEYDLEYSGNPTDGGIGRWVRIKGTELGMAEEFLLRESENTDSGIELERSE